MANISDEEKASVMQEWSAWMGALAEQGKLKGGVPFNPQTATVISSDGSVSNGYFASGNDVNVGGFIHLDVANLEEAIAIAKGSPALHGPGSSVEVKEYMHMDVPA